MHNRASQSGVPDEEADVGGQGPVEAVEVLSGAPLVPRGTGLEHVEGRPSTRDSIRIT
jgi:hypothetical protein